MYTVRNKKMTRYRPDNLPPLECTHTQIFDILDIFNTLNSDGSFFSSDISALFCITKNDACVRLNKLRRWGMIKIFSQGRPRSYQITNWEKNFLLIGRVKVIRLHRFFTFGLKNIPYSMIYNNKNCDIIFILALS